MQVFSLEVNGGAKKAMWTIIGGSALAVMGYVTTEINKVEPLAVKVKAVEDKVDLSIGVQDDEWRNQQAWNRLFLDNQHEAAVKQEEILRAIRSRP